MKLFAISWVRVEQLPPLEDDLADNMIPIDLKGNITIHLVESKQDALDEANDNPIEGYQPLTIRDITQPAVLAQAYLTSHLKPVEIDLDELARGNHP